MSGMELCCFEPQMCRSLNCNDEPPNNPPDDECPDLNLTIRGTLLPARRGTTRLSGDWYK